MSRKERQTKTYKRKKEINEANKKDRRKSERDKRDTKGGVRREEEMKKRMFKRQRGSGRIAVIILSVCH